MGLSLNAGTWLTIASVLVFGTFQLVAAYITAHHGQRKVLGEVGEVRDQVKNNHSRNLRDDLDDVRDAVHGIREDVGLLRDELREERSARVDLAQRVEQLARRRHQGW